MNSGSKDGDELAEGIVVCLDVLVDDDACLAVLLDGCGDGCMAVLVEGCGEVGLVVLEEGCGDGGLAVLAGGCCSCDSGVAVAERNGWKSGINSGSSISSSSSESIAKCSTISASLSKHIFRFIVPIKK